MQTVVLDALIPREDFEIASDIGNGGNTRNKTTGLMSYRRKCIYCKTSKTCGLERHRDGRRSWQSTGGEWLSDSPRRGCRKYRFSQKRYEI